MDNELMDAKNKALRLLSFRGRSTAEMRERLARKKIEPKLVERVIEDLTREGFLNDESFARQFAEGRMSGRPQAKRIVEWELKRKGLPKEARERAMEALSGVDEREVARRLCEQKLPQLRSLEPRKRRARLYALLARRGFSGDVIASTLNKLFKEMDAISE